MASIGLTIPAIAVASIWLEGALPLTVIVSMLTVVPGRAPRLRGGFTSYRSPPSSSLSVSPPRDPWTRRAARTPNPSRPAAPSGIGHRRPPYQRFHIWWLMRRDDGWGSQRNVRQQRSGSGRTSGVRPWRGLGWAGDLLPLAVPPVPGTAP
jgi:hypothetical protein